MLGLTPEFGRAIRMVHEAAAWHMRIWVFVLVISGLMPALSISLTRDLVDAVATLVDTGDGVETVVKWGGLLVAIMLATEGLRAIASWLFVAVSERVRDHTYDLIHRQSTAVDLSYYETPEYHNHLHRARDEAYYRPIWLLDSTANLFQGSVTLVSVLLLLVPYGVWLPLILILSALPALYLALRLRLKEHLWQLRTTADERKGWYYDWLLTSGETAAEVRTLELAEYFRDRFQRLRQSLRREYLKLIWSQRLAELVSSLFGFMVSGMIMLWMLGRVMTGAMSFGDLALFYRVFDQGQRDLRHMLQNIGQMYASSLFLRDFHEFMRLTPIITDPEHPVSLSETDVQVRFNGVTFSYPGAEKPVLRDFNLTIPAGKFVAVVGANGSGKSTLIKLMSRLYDPDEGRVELNGVDLRRISISSLRRMTSVMFQTPTRYSATVQENIALGDLMAAGDRVPEAAKLAGATQIVERLPEDYATLLGKWFKGGAELSGGEWQRIALARTLMRPSPVILLDEPTSNMDPWSESRWIAHFQQAVAGRTVVLITHRFTAITQADLIYVMDSGRIIEQGTHSQLLVKDGHYARLWRSREDVLQQ